MTRPYGAARDLLERALLSLPTRALAAKREVLRLEVDEVAADVAGPLGGMRGPTASRPDARDARARARARTRTRTVSTRCALGRGGAQASLATLLRALRGALAEKELALLGGVPRLRLRLLARSRSRARNDIAATGQGAPGVPLSVECDATEKGGTRFWFCADRVRSRENNNTRNERFTTRRKCNTNILYG